jgi:ABC-2 type transport system ATP-binding protein
MIILDHVTKSFRDMNAVNDLSLTLEKGEIFGLVGPNGAGKTTTIKMMTGLLKPDSGKIIFGKYDIVKEAVKAKSILGYIPDRAFLYEKLTAREFLIFIASLYGVEKRVALNRIGDLLELFGINDVQDELIESFSQGMRQRLLFSSALLHDPEVLLIDEPFTGLDPFGVRMLKGLITGLGAKGITIFLATHSLHIAEDLCNRVGFIRKGALVSVSNSGEIKDAEGGLEGLFLRLGEGA